MPEPVVPPAADPTPTPTPAPAAKPNGDEGWKALLEKREGDMGSLARKLFDENYGLREKNRELRARVAPEKAVVLTEDQAKAWAEFQALGHKPEDLKVALGERAQFKAELDTGRKATLYQTAAAAHGFKASVLADLAGSRNLEIEVKDETVQGRPARVAYVNHKDDAGKPAATPLPAYVAKHLADYLPSLHITPAPPGRPVPPGGPGTAPRANPNPPAPQLRTNDNPSEPRRSRLHDTASL